MRISDLQTIDLQIAAISNAIKMVSSSKLRSAIQTGKKLLKGVVVSDTDQIKFNEACAAIIEPNMRDTAFDVYTSYMDTDPDGWAHWIGQTFGDDWGELAEIINKYGY